MAKEAEPGHLAERSPSLGSGTGILRDKFSRKKVANGARTESEGDDEQRNGDDQTEAQPFELIRKWKGLGEMEEMESKKDLVKLNLA